MKPYLPFPASPFLKNLSTLPTNMQSIPTTSGLQRRLVHVVSVFSFLLLTFSLVQKKIILQYILW